MNATEIDGRKTTRPNVVNFKNNYIFVTTVTVTAVTEKE